MLHSFFQWTALEMEKPKSYGAFHLAFFFGGLAIAIILAWLLRNSSEKKNRTVLITIGSTLLVTEAYKQLFYYYVIGNESYQWWIFPFQLCSMPMYLCIIAPLLKQGGRWQNSIYNFLLAFNMMGGFISLLEPSGLVHEYWTLTIHAFLWHITLVFIGLYLGFSHRAGKTMKGYLGAVISFVTLSTIAFCINLIFWNVSKGSINMFFVGPRISPLFMFKDIAKNIGWYINTPIYIVCLCVAAFLFYFPFFQWNRRIESKNKNASTCQEPNLLEKELV